MKPKWHSYLFEPVVKALCFLVGFLFAQAVLFEATVPLFVPFYIACAIYEKRYKQFILAGGLLGALTLGVGQLLLILLQIFVYSLLRTKVVKQSPILALLLTTTIVQMVWQCLFYSFEVPPIVLLYVLFEVVASVIVYVFFKQALVMPNKLLVDWRYERMISVVILFSLLLISLNEIQFFNIAPATLLLQFVICCAAFYGPLPFATFVATIVSVTLSMSQLAFSSMIALYAVTGALVSNGKRLGKYGIAVLSIIPSIIFVFYDATLPLDVVHFTSITLGALLFLHVSTFVKITKTEIQDSSSIVQQSVDDFKRFNIFLHEMVELSVSENSQQKIEFNDFSVCQQCYRFERCWSQPNMEIRLKDLLYAKQYGSEARHIKAEQLIKENCIRSVHLLQEFQHRVMQFNVTNQQYYSRKLVGQQLKQMGQHFERVVEQSIKNGEKRGTVEEALRQKLGENCLYVTIEKMYFSHLMGQIHCVETVDEEELQQQLTAFFNEPVEVYGQSFAKGVVPTIKYRFRSAIRYEMEYDIYNKTSAVVSGDQAVITEVERGLHAVLVADGMGTGQVAREQSKQLLYLLRQCMQYQLSPDFILLTLQYLLNPLVQDSYATLDLLIYDLKNGQLFVWKTGSTATYIVRGDQLITIESRTAPLGTLQQQTNAEKVQLLAGDYVFILTDGMFESELYEEQESFLQQQLIRHANHDWSLATILYEVMESFKNRYNVTDDVTFIATKIEHVQHQWTTVKYNVK